MTAPEGEHGHGARASELLYKAVEGDHERVTIGEILDKLDAQAFGLATLLFSLPSCVPMPPGVPTAVGVVLLIISFQMVIGRHELWLPRFLTKRSFPRSGMVKALDWFKPTMTFIERLARPRVLILTGKFGTVLIGVIVLIMAIILILPLPPGGNFPPALACAILGLGLAERDGLIVFLGLMASVLALYLCYLVSALLVEFVMGWFGHTVPAASPTLSPVPTP